MVLQSIYLQDLLLVKQLEYMTFDGRTGMSLTWNDLVLVEKVSLGGEDLVSYSYLGSLIYKKTGEAHIVIFSDFFFIEDLVQYHIYVFFHFVWIYMEIWIAFQHGGKAGLGLVIEYMAWLSVTFGICKLISYS